MALMMYFVKSVRKEHKMVKKREKGFKNTQKYDIFKILDMIELLQMSKRQNQTLYVPKKSYRLAKQLLKAQKKADVIKIKTY